MILFDTNIFIDMLSGHPHAAKELISYPDPAISVITMMELRAGQVARPGEAALLDALLHSFTILPIDVEVSESAIVIRGKSLLAPPKVKLPDAIIGATAEVWGIPIVTRNPKDFAHVTVPVHVPYEIDPDTGVVTNVRSPYGTPATPTFTRLKQVGAKMHCPLTRYLAAPPSTPPLHETSAPHAFCAAAARPPASPAASRPAA